MCPATVQVHSECAESEYINSRPFRVNAGPVIINQAPATSMIPKSLKIV